MLCVKCKILIIDTSNEYLKKAMGWLIGFSIVNLILGYLLFKKIKKLKNNESCSLLKAASMSSTYLKGGLSGRMT